METSSAEICGRLAQIRREFFGERGKARFARELGIRPSSYHHYEIDRTPPAELLVLAARLTGASLEWLLTGEGEMVASPESGPSPSTRHAHADSSSADEQLIARLRNLLARKPELSRSVVGFLDLLDGVADSFPTVAAPKDPTARAPASPTSSPI